MSTADLDAASGSGQNATSARDDIVPSALCQGNCSAEVEANVTADLDLISAAVARGLERIDDTIALVRAALQACLG